MRHTKKFFCAVSAVFCAVALAVLLTACYGQGGRAASEREVSSVSTDTDAVSHPTSAQTVPDAVSHPSSAEPTGNGQTIPAVDPATQIIKNFIMQCDYYIDQGKMRVTRDYGETWIDVDISAAALQETLDFYGTSASIPDSSYYISADPGGTIAILYREIPRLLLSKDGGALWQTVTFDAADEVGTHFPFISRVIGFSSETEGWAAFGSAWSMGHGEAKIAYYTHDGGFTWEKKDLPLDNSSNTLTGMAFIDSKNGVLSLNDTSFGAAVPILLYTTDGGDTWTETSLPGDQIQSDAYVASKIDTLTFADGVYTLICGQGSDSNKKAEFQSASLAGPWEFVACYTAVVHTVG
ncbi:MAG: hypothetical protein FWC62_09445 [Firmicutes bacterium]|nr:hypothetical protein [Bacillota bacterium]